MTESDLDRWDRTNNILAEIMEERERQFDKWGDQRLPFTDLQDPTGIYLMGRTYAAFETRAKQRCDAYRDTYLKGEGDPRNAATVLLEEVFEALAARTPEDRRTELIQIAAVCVKIVSVMDRADGISPAGPPVTDSAARYTDLALPEGRMEVAPVSLTIYPKHDHGDGPRPCMCGGTGQAAKCTTPETHNAGCSCPPELPLGYPGIGPHDLDADGEDGGCGCGLPAGDPRHTDPETNTFETWKGQTIRTDPFVPSVTPEEIDANYRKDLTEDAWEPVRDVLRHPYNGADRLHGICRCGSGPDAEVHRFQPSTVHTHTYDRLHGLCRCGEARGDGS